jgi:xylan 1,4-beta-xylosidase
MYRRDVLKLATSGVASGFMAHQIWGSTRSFSAVSDNLLISKVQVDWQQVVSTTTPLLFGSNDYEITSPKKAADLEFQKLLSQLNIPLIRVNYSKLCDRWADSISQKWNEAKIKAGYDVSYPQQPVIVQNIPRAPKWMKKDEDGLLALSEHDNYANFCAKLVNILNKKHQRKILYWEPFNELDKKYQNAGKLSQLWQLYNQVAKKMKAQDSTIKIGGPVMTWDNKHLLKEFLQKCGSQVDFISWHRYGTADANKPTDELLADTFSYGKQVQEFRLLTNKYISDRHIPLFLSEYNINYAWDSGELRQNNPIGAIWFASVLKHLAEAGLDMAASWHLKDGIYGMVDPHNRQRPVAHFFAWGIKYLTGEVVKTESESDSLEVMAVKQEDDTYSILLINKSSLPTQVSLENISNNSAFLQALSLNQQGIKTKTQIDTQSLLLSPYSLLLLRS